MSYSFLHTGIWVYSVITDSGIDTNQYLKLGLILMTIPILIIECEPAFQGSPLRMNRIIPPLGLILMLSYSIFV
ncbi:MAG: hypothetical protein ABEI13_03890 [Candidatus Paceibacteria bacterium]